RGVHVGEPSEKSPPMSVVESTAASTMDVSRWDASALVAGFSTTSDPRSSTASQIESAPTLGVEWALQSTTTIRSNDMARGVGRSLRSDEHVRDRREVQTRGDDGEHVPDLVIAEHG